jgi:hypothetical protein
MAQREWQLQNCYASVTQARIVKGAGLGHRRHAQLACGAAASRLLPLHGGRAAAAAPSKAIFSPAATPTVQTLLRGLSFPTPASPRPSDRMPGGLCHASSLPGCLGKSALEAEAVKHARALLATPNVGAAFPFPTSAGTAAALTEPVGLGLRSDRRPQLSTHTPWRLVQGETGRRRVGCL